MTTVGIKRVHDCILAPNQIHIPLFFSWDSVRLYECPKDAILLTVHQIHDLQYITQDLGFVPLCGFPTSTLDWSFQYKI